MSTLTVSVTSESPFVIISLKGSLDVNTAPDFHKKIKDEISKGVKTIIINMKELEYIASAGVGVLINGNEILNMNGGELRLCGLSNKVSNIFKLLGFLDLFKVYNTLNEAKN